MTEWVKVEDKLPPVNVPVWGGWYERDGTFVSEIFVLIKEANDFCWCRCKDIAVVGGFADYCYQSRYWSLLDNPIEP